MNTCEVLGFALAILAAPVCAETVSCEGSIVSVSGPQLKLVEQTCEAVRQAEVLFAQCNMPALSDPVRINIVEKVAPGSVAQFHCGEDLIEVLALPQMQERRNMNGIFGSLSVEDYYQSVVVHELAHAALDNVPCARGTCVAAHEYAAYSMQIKSLTSDSRSEIGVNLGFDRQISLEEINAMLLAIAPDAFKRKVWAHFSQHDDPCGFIDQI